MTSSVPGSASSVPGLSSQLSTRSGSGDTGWERLMLRGDHGVLPRALRFLGIEQGRGASMNLIAHQHLPLLLRIGPCTLKIHLIFAVMGSAVLTCAGYTPIDFVLFCFFQRTKSY